MGVGYWTCEHLIYNEKTGELLTDRSWNYHVPLAKDIPIDFRIKLRPNSFFPISPMGAKSKPIYLLVRLLLVLFNSIRGHSSVSSLISS